MKPGGFALHGAAQHGAAGKGFKRWYPKLRPYIAAARPEPKPQGGGRVPLGGVFLKAWPGTVVGKRNLVQYSSKWSGPAG